MSDPMSATSPLSLSGHSHTDDDEPSTTDHDVSPPLSAPQSPTDATAKLFIGQIPRHIAETDIRRLFEAYGDIQHIVILRDKHTNEHKGCAFLTYANRSSADRAISAVHEKLSLHNRPIVVRYAGDAHLPSECKLFVGMLSRATSEQTVHALFSAFGSVKEVFVMRDAHHQSKGCAFVKMTSRDDALVAISELNDVYHDDGAPRKLVVRFAESKANKQPNSERNGGGANQMISPQMIMPQWPQPWQYPYYRQPIPPTSPNGRFSLQGVPQQFQTQYYVNNDLYHAQAQAHANMSAAQAHAHAHAAAAAIQSQQFYDQMPPQQQPQSPAQAQLPRGPPGSNLFVYNIPDTFIDVDLHHLFSAFGIVLSTKVYRDKSTGLSRGFGFVSFAEPQAAEKAIAALNGFTVANKRLKVMYKKGTDNASANGNNAHLIANGHITHIQYPSNGLMNGMNAHHNGITTAAAVTRMANINYY